MELGEKWLVNLACDSDFHVNRRNLLHAANLRHETDGFTSPPKACCGYLRPKNPTASAGFKPPKPLQRVDSQAFVWHVPY
jgi:hypothetical protein